MEDEFKVKMAQKFAEDERLEQMNAQKRRMKELEHKRDIESLWEEKLTVYREQREEEWEEIRQKQVEEEIKRQAIQEYKAQLLAENAQLLNQFNPKAANQYNASQYQ